MSRLKLTRPLVVFDLETTGANAFRDRIVEFASVTLYPDGSRERFVSKVNPLIPIPPDSTKIHGISNEDVRDAPTFKQLAPRVVELFTDADVGGFNVARFDVPLLQREMERAGVEMPEGVRYIADAQVIFHRMEPRDLSAAVQFYCHRELVGAHGALADAEASLDVLLEQIERYAEGDKVVPDNLQELDVLSQRRDKNHIDALGRLIWEGDEVAIGFGKYRGVTLRSIRKNYPDYLQWIMRKDFSSEVKKIVEAASRGQFPKKEDFQKSKTEGAPATPQASLLPLTASPSVSPAPVSPALVSPAPVSPATVSPATGLASANASPTTTASAPVSAKTPATVPTSADATREKQVPAAPGKTTERKKPKSKVKDDRQLTILPLLDSGKK